MTDRSDAAHRMVVAVRVGPPLVLAAAGVALVPVAGPVAGAAVIVGAGAAWVAGRFVSVRGRLADREREYQLRRDWRRSPDRDTFLALRGLLTGQQRADEVAALRREFVRRARPWEITGAARAEPAEVGPLIAELGADQPDVLAELLTLPARDAETDEIRRRIAEGEDCVEAIDRVLIATGRLAEAESILRSGMGAWPAGIAPLVRILKLRGRDAEVEPLLRLEIESGNSEAAEVLVDRLRLGRREAELATFAATYALVRQVVQATAPPRQAVPGGRAAGAWAAIDGQQR